jgi:hypothetical protein
MESHSDEHTKLRGALGSRPSEIPAPHPRSVPSNKKPRKDKSPSGA